MFESFMEIFTVYTYKSSIHGANRDWRCLTFSVIVSWCLKMSLNLKSDFPFYWLWKMSGESSCFNFSGFGRPALYVRIWGVFWMCSFWLRYNGIYMSISVVLCIHCSQLQSVLILLMLYYQLSNGALITKSRDATACDVHKEHRACALCMQGTNIVCFHQNPVT